MTPAVQESDRARREAFRSGGAGGLIDRIGIHNVSLVLALLVLVALFGWIRADVFFSARNLLNI
jgi:L-arabinose transport system permease protein